MMEEMLEALEGYALMCTDRQGREPELLALLYALGHRGMGMSDSLRAYSWRMLRQVEALSAAMLYAGVPRGSAVGAVRTLLPSFPDVSEFREILPHRMEFAAPYVRNGGKATFPDGSDNVRGVPVDGYDAIRLLFGAAVAKVWMRNQVIGMREREDCAGFYVLRGSDFNCSLCDSFVGYHDKYEEDSMPPYHPSCCCYAITVYR